MSDSENKKSTTPSCPKAYSYIRMSTEMQLRGDSKRRQEEASRAYAEKHGLELVEGPELHDIGVSAYKGANVKGAGALGRFMTAVEKGQIETGSYLLVESLDRLSRQDIMKSLGLFIQIIESGIKIVTLSDDYVYDSARTSFYELLYSMVIMSRAHEESKMKSLRVSAAIDAKVQIADTKKVTAQCPSWLRLSDDREEFMAVPDKAKVVQRLFEWCAKGMGDYSIAKKLNEDGVPPFGTAKNWGSSSVGAIIRNQAVIGVWQPFKTVDGERIPARDPINDYFPAVIDKELFYRCQKLRSERSAKKGGGGRKGNNAIANLFSGLARCGTCGGKMVFLNKGKNATYLTCDTAHKGGDCEKRGYPYADFETSFFIFVTEIDFSSIEDGEIKPTRKVALSEQRRALQGQVESLVVQQERTYDLIKNKHYETGFIANKLSQLDNEINTIKEKIDKLDDAIMQSENNSASPEKLANLVRTIKTKPDDYVLRSHLAQVIKDQVSWLALYPYGAQEAHKQSIKRLQASQEWQAYNAAQRLVLLEQLKAEVDTTRLFVASFKANSQMFRKVMPDPKDPTKLKTTLTDQSIKEALQDVGVGKSEQFTQEELNEIFG